MNQRDKDAALHLLARAGIRLSEARFDLVSAIRRCSGAVNLDHLVATLDSLARDIGERRDDVRDCAAEADT